MSDGKTLVKKELQKYTIWFLFLSFILWIPFLIHGTTLVAYGDSYDQFLPAYLYIGRYLRDFFSGQFYLYDFSIGYGENAIGVLNLFGLGDPLNFFAVFATPKTADFLFVLFIFVRVYLSGLGMILLLLYHNSEGKWAYAGGIMYAFSLYTFWRGFRFYTFLSAMYLLPFLIYSMERLIKETNSYRRGILFTVLVGIQACCGYYFLYFQTIFLFAYYIIICIKVSGVKELFRQIRMLALYYILGILLSGVFLFPSIEAFLNSSRSISTDEGWKLLFSIDEIKLICSNLFVPLLWSENMSLGLLAICVFTIAACFIKGYVHKKERAMTVLLFCMYISPVFWRISNGFSYGESRWSYVVYFWMAYLTFIVLNQLWQKENTNRVIVIGGVLAASSLLLHFVIYEDKIRTFAYCMLVTGIAIILWKKKYHLWGIVICTCVL